MSGGPYWGLLGRLGSPSLGPNGLYDLRKKRLTYSSTPQLPFKIPHIPTNRDQKALNRGTLGGSGFRSSFQVVLIGDHGRPGLSFGLRRDRKKHGAFVVQWVESGRDWEF